MAGVAGLNKWVEIGNSGMFRPEMLRPMGFPEVRAWVFALDVERETEVPRCRMCRASPGGCRSSGPR